MAAAAAAAAAAAQQVGGNGQRHPLPLTAFSGVAGSPSNNLSTLPVGSSGKNLNHKKDTNANVTNRRRTSSDNEVKYNYILLPLLLK